jgi:hypothetical protein
VKNVNPTRTAAQKFAERAEQNGASQEGVADVFFRIGDKDGFGFSNIGQYKAADGGRCDRDGNGTLNDGDCLPDLNRNGRCRVSSGDEFNNQNAAERSDSENSAKGITINSETAGSIFTDVSLSRSWSSRFGPFPDGNHRDDNSPTFVFSGTVDNPKGLSSRLELRADFGDYDVVPGEARLTNARGQTKTFPLERQSNAKGDDGLVQRLFAIVDVNHFVNRTTGELYLVLSFVVPNEPFFAVNSVELTTNRTKPPTPDTNELNVTGHTKAGPGGTTKYDITTHAGEKRKSEAAKFIPETEPVNSDGELEVTFGPGTHQIFTSKTFTKFVLAPGATVEIRGNVTLNITDNIDIPRGAKVVMMDDGDKKSIAKVFAGGPINIEGAWINSGNAKDLVITSTNSSGISLTVTGDKEAGTGVTGCVIGETVEMHPEDGAKIKFTYDVDSAQIAVEKLEKRLEVKTITADGKN